MLERVNPILRIVAIVLAGIVLLQAARLASPKSRAVSDFAFGGNAAAPDDKAASTNAPAKIPPAVQAQIDKVKESQILGMIMRPPPMALMGIAGKDVILRGPNGQTGLVREGEQLGGVKLIKIGTNRVLIEHEGTQKELMLFQGFGSESLMPRTKEEKPSEAPTRR